ncbi:MAG: sigma-70 family RNA polymerase sigma factor [Gammaproteobacteria bacterium]
MTHGGEFEALLTAQIPRLRRYARVLARTAARADDLVQDTLERAWAKRHLWQTGSDLRAWAFSIMHNVHANQARRREPESAGQEIELSSAATHEHGLALRDMQRALAALPVEQREVLMLVAVEELRYDEVAAILNVPLGTVMSRLSRARERLRTMMNGATTPALQRVK